MYRSLFAALAILAAPSAVQAAPAPATVVVEQFFDALAREDAAGLLALCAPDSTVVAPYNPNGDATDAGIRTFPAALYLRGAMSTYDNIVFLDRRFSVADDGATVWMEARGDLVVAAAGTPYRNRYVFKFEIKDGKIARMTEYTNVVTLAAHGVTARPPERR